MYASIYVYTNVREENIDLLSHLGAKPPSGLLSEIVIIHSGSVIALAV